MPPYSFTYLTFSDKSQPGACPRSVYVLTLDLSLSNDSFKLNMRLLSLMLAALL